MAFKYELKIVCNTKICTIVLYDKRQYVVVCEPKQLGQHDVEALFCVHVCVCVYIGERVHIFALNKRDGIEYIRKRSSTFNFVGQSICKQ